MCSVHIRATSWIKTNLWFVRLNKCGLFTNKHNGMASIKKAGATFNLLFQALSFFCQWRNVKMPEACIRRTYAVEVKLCLSTRRRRVEVVDMWLYSFWTSPWSAASSELPTWKLPTAPVEQEAGWAPKLVWRLRGTKKIPFTCRDFRFFSP